MAVNAQKGMLEFCDLTQQINLGIDSWDQWLDKQYGIEKGPRRLTRTTWTSNSSIQKD